MCQLTAALVTSAFRFVIIIKMFCVLNLRVLWLVVATLHHIYNTSGSHLRHYLPSTPFHCTLGKGEANGTADTQGKTLVLMGQI